MSVKCPRCGAEGTLYRQKVSGRTYIYIRHRRGKAEKKCYLGPADEYVFVQRVYSDAYVPLSLTNVFDVDLTNVLRHLIDAIRLQHHRFVILKQFNKLRELYNSLRKLQPELNILINDIEKDLPTGDEQKIVETLGLESGP
ncbi:MAG: hypothetical protein QXJ64_08950 [Thermosphaera sp.]